MIVHYINFNNIVQEKDIQLQQLSTDKEKLQTKLADLHGLVDRLVNDKQVIREDKEKMQTCMDWWTDWSMIHR